MLSPSRLIGNLAVVIFVILLGAWGADLLFSWVGYSTGILCLVLSPVIGFAYQIGALLIMIGILIWTFSLFRSRAGIVLALGGVLLFIIPLVTPHYLSAACG